VEDSKGEAKKEKMEERLEKSSGKTDFGMIGTPDAPDFLKHSGRIPTLAKPSPVARLAKPQFSSSTNSLLTGESPSAPDYKELMATAGKAIVVLVEAVSAEDEKSGMFDERSYPLGTDDVMGDMPTRDDVMME
jgi:hypothetical protein